MSSVCKAVWYGFPGPCGTVCAALDRARAVWVPLGRREKGSHVVSQPEGDGGSRFRRGYQHPGHLSRGVNHAHGISGLWNTRRRQQGLSIPRHSRLGYRGPRQCFLERVEIRSQPPRRPDDQWRCSEARIGRQCRQSASRRDSELAGDRRSDADRFTWSFLPGFGWADRLTGPNNFLTLLIGPDVTETGTGGFRPISMTLPAPPEIPPWW